MATGAWLGKRSASRVQAAGVVVDPPALDQDLRFAQAVEDLAFKQLIPELCLVTPIFFTAVAIGWP
jgi:hypothetical protein